MTQLLDVSLCENDPVKEKGGKPVFILPPVGGSCQELRLAGSLYPNSSSPHRIPLRFLFLFLSSLVVWADPQSISPQTQPQKNDVYCIYDLYMVLMVLSPLHLMAFYLPDNRHPQLQPVHRAIHLKSSLQRASSSSSLAARHSAGIMWAPSGPSPSVVVSPQWEGSLSFVSLSSCCFGLKINPLNSLWKIC